MNKEDVCFKLIELYYKNISIFKGGCICLKELVEIYNAMLKILKVESDE